MTERDTFNKLRRIPRAEAEKIIWEERLRVKEFHWTYYANKRLEKTGWFCKIEQTFASFTLTETDNFDD